MQPGIPLKWPPTIDDIVGIAFSSIAIFFLLHGLPYQSSSAQLSSQTTNQSSRNLLEDAAVLEETNLPAQADSGLPVRLKIPKINIDVALESVGLTPDGRVGVPDDHTTAAWFNLGPRPGQDGSAVIAGHYGWRAGKPSAFDDLYTLRKGDEVYVEDDEGVTISFVVRESRRYDPEVMASDVFDSGDGKSHLNLITCEGVWDKISQNYSDRLVVFTDRLY